MSNDALCSTLWCTRLSQSASHLIVTFADALIYLAIVQYHIQFVAYTVGGTVVYKQFGYSLNRSSRDQINNGTAVTKAELQLGDLVFFSKNGSYPTHVGLYIGNGDFIHASTPQSGVKIDSLYSSYYDSDYYLGPRRII